MRIVVRFVALVVVIVALLGVSGYAADFSADMVSNSPEGSFTGKFYISGNKTRVDMPEGSTISRMDKSVVWVLMEKEKMYMEQPIDTRSAASMQEKVEGEVERKELGKEKINGRNTTKYLVTIQSQGNREQVYQWIDESIHFPVKTAAINGSWSSEFKNINAGSQSQGLFEIPSGYAKMSLGMDNLKDLLGSFSK